MDSEKGYKMDLYKYVVELMKVNETKDHHVGGKDGQ